MKRHIHDARPQWQQTVESLGLVYHHTNHPDGSTRPYWDERISYSFTLDEVLSLEQQTAELHRLYLEAADHVVTKKRYGDLGIPFFAIPAIEAAWEADPPSILGRFDLHYDGTGPAKLLEYNADTPTGLVEAAVVQWQWREEVASDNDQWNSIHERLIEAWKRQAPQFPSKTVHFAHSNYDTSGEDLMNTAYLRDTADQAGLTTIGIQVEDIGWNHERRRFVDLDDRAIDTIFKLYPWEWMLDERFGAQVITSLPTTQWIEPIWKLLLANKGMLAILWELFPEHPNLLPAYLDLPRELDSFARKPFFGREGSGVTLVEHQQTITEGKVSTYEQEPGDQRMVFQQLAPLPDFDGAHPVLGSWVIDHEPAGIGIRESDSLITDNLSRFVPHVIETPHLTETDSN